MLYQHELCSVQCFCIKFVTKWSVDAYRLFVQYHDKVQRLYTDVIVRGHVTERLSLLYTDRMFVKFSLVQL
jgi:hypothetical protein